MQHKDPKHTHKLSQTYIENKEEQRRFQLMSCPTQSVDLISIELVWDDLDRKVRAKQPKMQVTSGNSCRKVERIYIHSSSSLE